VSDPVLLYGATGYTGRLVLEVMLAKGLSPVLAGRSRGALEELARPQGLEVRVASLDETRALDAALTGMRAVLHCAGPFSRMAPPMVEACLRNGAHYLDITGEIAVFELMHSLDARARAAGISLLPGVGFDVVPSDCLAAHLKRRLPEATELTLAFAPGTGPSHGTATTAVENIAQGGAVRRSGVITRVPTAWRTRDIAFPDRTRHAMTIPWGDVSTAFHSTGIPDISVYLAVRPQRVRLLRLGRPFLTLLGTGVAQRFLKSRIKARSAGPSAERRESARSRFWGEATEPNGREVRSTLVAPDGYTLTARTAVAAVRRVLAGGVPVGFQTPSMAFGADFILEFTHVEREDLA
jgi:short subunit dehydrogenase-like uncharacterized protein